MGAGASCGVLGRACDAAVEVLRTRVVLRVVMWFSWFFDICRCAVESNRVFFVVNIYVLIAVSGVHYDRVWRRCGSGV